MSDNTPIEFDDIYQAVYNRNDIHKMETIRRKAKNGAIFLCVLILASVLVRLSDYYKSSYMILFNIALCISFFIYKCNESNYKIIYKKEVITSFIKLVSDKLEYMPTSSEFDFMKEQYKYANFDNSMSKGAELNDYIEGTLSDDTFVKMVNLQMAKRRGNDDKIELNEGIFAYVDCDKDIGIDIKISINQFEISKQYNKVEMDSTEFEKCFDIYSENKILAMRLLTSDVMQTLVDFYNKYNIDYEIVIRYNRIYMRFFTGSMFEPKLFGDSVNKAHLGKCFCIFKFIQDITKEINKALQQIEI